MKSGSPKDSGNKSLKRYLKEIAKIPILTADQEKALARKIQKGDEKALKHLVEANLRFVVSFSKKYRGCGLPLMDLINDGNIGLIEAAKRFDPDRNVRFLTYAVWWIRQSIVQALADSGGDFHLSQKDANLLFRLGRSISVLTGSLKRTPTAEEIAENMEIPEEKVQELMMLNSENISLENFISQEKEYRVSDTLEQEMVESADDQFLHKALKHQLYTCLKDLSEKEMEVLIMRFGLDGEGKRTLKEIGEKLELSRERIRQIEHKALIQLKEMKKCQQLRGYLN